MGSKQNICKFIQTQHEEYLSTTQFIFEANADPVGAQHCFTYNVMYLVLSGTGQYHCADHSFALSPNTLFFSFADLPFSIDNTDGLTYLYISFTGTGCAELFLRFGIDVQHCCFRVQEGMGVLWYDNLMCAHTENIDLLSRSMLFLGFSALKRTDRPGNDLSAAVLAYLEEHFTDPTLSLSETAAALGYNTKYLSHIFKKRFGMGFSEYLRLKRIRYAVVLMDNGVTSVKNVAVLSGFTDPLYFSKVFTSLMGVSPARYRAGLSSSLEQR